MKLSPPFFALLFTTFAGRALAATYSLSQSIVGSEFYTAFNFEVGIRYPPATAPVHRRHFSGYRRSYKWSSVGFGKP